MADKKISALTAATTPLAGTELVPLVQSSTTKNVTVANLTAGRSISASDVTLSGGTANGVLYLNASKVATSGSALQFDATNLLVGTTTPYISTFSGITVQGATSGTNNNLSLGLFKAGTPQILNGDVLGNIYFYGVDNDVTAGNNNIGARIASIATTNWTTDGTTSNAALVFYTHGTASGAPPERLRIASDGDVTFSTGNVVQGTAAKGVNFTANTPAAGMTSQLLNWYEEGTWTPTLTVTGYTFTFGTQTGLYTRIGNTVFFKMYMTASYSTGSGTDVADITGLPFTSSSSAANNGGVSFYPDTGSALWTRVGVARTGSNSSKIRVGNGWNGAAVGGVNWALMTADTEFEISGHYYV